MESFLQHIVFKPFEIAVAWELFAMVMLLSCSALMSASETAFFSLSPNEVNKLRKSESTSAHAALKLLGDQDYLLATILIVNNLMNICAVIVSNIAIDHIVSFEGMPAVDFTVRVVLVTFLLLLFGEIIPKIFATYNALKLTRIVSIPLLFLKKMLRPLSFLIVRSSSKINNAMAKKKVNISIDELSNAIKITTNQNTEEKKILSGIVSYVNIEVDEIMCPRVDITSIDEECVFSDIRRVIVETGFSRIPVYRETIDNITGILYVKDLMPYLDAKDDFQWQKLCRKPYFVPEHKKINDLFYEFQENKVHLAIVVDEYGSTLGLLSLEDILEEIVGEISDESDVSKRYFTQIDDNTFIFEGKTHLIDFLKIVGVDDGFFDEVKGEAESLAGMMLEVKRDFLNKGDTLYFGVIALSVESVKGRRIDKIKVVIDRKGEQWGNKESNPEKPL